MIICNIGMINRPEIYGQQIPDSLLERKSIKSEQDGPWILEIVYFELLKKASLEKSHLSDPENEKLQK